MKLSSLMTACLCVGMSAPATSQQIQTFGKTGVVHQLSNAKLTSKQKRHFQKFKKQRGYFSYFYVAQNEDHSFAVSHFHSLESARLAGEAGCVHFSKSKKAKCTPYAVSLPKSFSPTTAKASGMGSTAYEVFSGKYPRNIKLRKGWGAFAISGGSTFGWSTGNFTKEEAADTALQFCTGSVSKILTSIPFEFRKWMKRNKHDQCRVVHTTRSQ